MDPFTKPKPFLQIRYERLDLEPTLRAFCAGFEGGKWRADELAHHLFDWLPEFSLRSDEHPTQHNPLFWSNFRTAARRVYQAAGKDTSKRGEIGEILLHIACRQTFDTYPTVSKVYYKSSAGETVKGFDLVHTRFIESEDELEIWLGEAKFYKDGKSAVKDAVKSIKAHVDAGFLKNEKLFVFSKVPKSTPGYEKIEWLMHVGTSTDEIVSRMVVPVLIAYESTAISDDDNDLEKYAAALKPEVEELNLLLESESSFAGITMHCFYVPMGQKSHVIAKFDQVLEASE